MARLILNYSNDKEKRIAEIMNSLANYNCSNIKKSKNLIKTKKELSDKNIFLKLLNRISIRINTSTPQTIISAKLGLIGVIIQLIIMIAFLVMFYFLISYLLSDFTLLFLLPSAFIVVLIYIIILLTFTRIENFSIQDISISSLFDFIIAKNITKLRQHLISEKLKENEHSKQESENIIEVNNLKVEFSIQEGIVKAVNGISYVVGKGKSLAIVGESGCGKTVSSMSLLKLIPMPPGKITEGEVLFNGKNLLNLTENELQDIRGKYISVIFQDPMTSLNPYTKIGEQIIEMFVFHLGIDTKSARKKAIDLLKLVNIPNAEQNMESYPFEFSGGMRQRVMIAIALACNPDLIIADEPTTDLDVTIQAQILDLIRELKEKKNLSLILITHDIGLVSEICEDIVVMYAGYIVEQGKTQIIINDSKHPYTKKLIESVPFLDRDITRLSSIEGSPPDLINLPDGCPFYDRCDYRIEQCKCQMPPIRNIGEEHTIRCWVNI